MRRYLLSDEIWRVVMKSIFILFLLIAPLTVGTRAQQPAEKEQSVTQSAIPVDRKICVAGAVVKPSEVTFREGLTVTQAIKEAGGLVRESKSTEVYVISAMLKGWSRVIYVDLKAIEKKPYKDLQLQDYDVVFVVPRNREKRNFQSSVNPCPSLPVLNPWPIRKDKL